MQKRKNDVKARTTLLLALPDEHQLRFSKHKTAQELLAAILKTFGGNEATKKTKKNLLKQQYGNFKAEGLETLEQTFNRLQVIISHLEFMDIEIKKDDLNQNGSQIKFEDINQIDEDDMEEMDIKWNMALLSMRADRAPRSQDRARRDNYRQGSKVEEQAPKNMIYHYKLGLSQVEARLAEHRNQEVKYCEKIKVLEFKIEFRANCIESFAKDLESLKKEKGELETKLTGFQTTSKYLDSLLKSQRLDKNKEGLRYSVVPPPLAQVYSPPKKDFSWTRLLEFVDDTVTDYSRPSPAIESTSNDAQNKNPSITETKASPNTISVKLFIMFVKATDRATPRIILMTKAIETVVALGGCKIIGKGTIKTGKLEFENVYFVKDLKGESRNKEMNDFCSHIKIKREFSNARTPQQNGVAERRNRTLIKVAR
nr:hypothetical protein [Tanacetum cinerariifolium]